MKNQIINMDYPITEGLQMEFFMKYNDPLCLKANSVKISLYDFGYARVNSIWNVSAISPPYTRLYYIVDGKGYIEYGKEKRAMLPGNWCLIPSGLSCYFSCNDMMEHLYFHVTLSGIDEIDLLGRIGEPYFLKDETHPHLSFIDYLDSDSLLDALIVKEKVHKVIMHLIKKKGLNAEIAELSQCVQKAIEFINNHLHEKLDIATISEYAYVSKCTLSNKFKSELKITINEYILRQKMFKAEQLLRSSDMTIAQISNALGFSEQFYFSRCFKKTHGMSPVKYRKSEILFLPNI